MLLCLRCTHSAVRASVCRALYSVLVVDEAKDEVYNNGEWGISRGCGGNGTARGKPLVR